MSSEVERLSYRILRRVVIHASVVLASAALAMWSTFPLILHPGVAIPGTGAGDNLSYLWNLWWFQYAWAHDLPYFTTPMLCAPFGTQIVLHTHTTLPSLMAWPMLRLISLAAAHNLVLIAGLAANAGAMYALAYHATRAVLPSAAAGLAFGGSAFVHLHLLGHFNLTHAWVLPLFALAFIRFAAGPSYAGAAFVAVAAAAVTYTDYYFTVYCAAFAVLWMTLRSFSLTVSRSGGSFPGLAGACAALSLAVLALVVAITVSGGVAFMVGSTRVSLQTVRNPLTALWVLLALWILFRWPIRLSIARRAESRSPFCWRPWAVALGVYVVLAAPIFAAAVRMFADGDYVTQRVFWRSSPRGVDAATALLGHPRHILTGQWSAAAHRAIGANLEQIAWIGLVPLILAVRSFRDAGRDRELRLWMVVAAVFFVWSLGPFLRVAGVETALPLPWALARYIPMLSNARQPGRAIVIVQLAICMIAAIALARHNGRRAALSFALLLVLESIPVAVPLYALPRRDTVDAHLAAAGNTDIVVELPAGLRDGFGDAGALDHRALGHQMLHEHPIVGGFVARISDRLKADHARSDFLRNVLQLSRGTGDPALLRPAHYLVVNRDTLPNADALSRDVLERNGFVFVIADGPRELYVGSSGRVR